LDLRKAFDMVNHKILIRKLHNFGIRGLAGNWFSSYLSNRRQVVQIDQVKSNYAIITHGVPQGSILGPVLFLLYISDLPANLPDSKTVLFPDNTNILFHNIEKSCLQIKINEMLIKLEKWIANNGLKLNTNKTVNMFQSTISTRSYSDTTKQYHNSGSEGHKISRDMDRLQFNFGKSCTILN